MPTTIITNPDGSTQTIVTPDPPAQPISQSKDQFLAWFDATFGSNATPTRTQLANAWPVQ